MSTSIAARSALRDTVRRLKRIMVNAGVQNPGDASRIHGDMPFQDAVNLFKEDMEKVNETLDGRSKRGDRDGQAITVAHEIDKQLRGLDAQLLHLRQLAENSEHLRVKIAKKSAKKPTEEDAKKMDILSKEYAARRELCDACQKGLETLKEKNRTLPTRQGAKERESLIGHRIADTKKGPSTKYTNVDDAIAAGADGAGGPADLERDEETKEMMKQKKAKDQQIDKALDAIGAAVGRLKVNALAISEEVDKQNVMLDNLEVKMDKTNDRLAGINGRLNKLVKGTGKLNIFMYILFIILILAIVGYVLYEMDVIPI